MDNKTSNINFTSNIRFISYKGYEKLASMPNTAFVKEIHNLRQVETIKNQGATNGVIYCIAGVVKDFNEKTTKLFHWFPNLLLTEFSTVRIDILKNELNLLSKHKIKGFLIGGITKGPDGTDPKFGHKLSTKLINIIKAPFKNARKADFTLFFSQDAKHVDSKHRPEAAFVYNKKNDTYYVNCKKYENEKWNDLLDANKIRDHFDYINISEKDKVFIGSKQIDNEFLNKKMRKE